MGNYMGRTSALAQFLPPHASRRSSRRCDKLQHLSSLLLAQHLAMRRRHPGERARAEVKGKVENKRVRRMKARKARTKKNRRIVPTAAMPTERKRTRRFERSCQKVRKTKVKGRQKGRHPSDPGRPVPLARKKPNPKPQRRLLAESEERRPEKGEPQS